MNSNNLNDIKTGVELIAEERQRQLNELEYTPCRDDGYVLGELAIAASVYAKPNFLREMRVDPLEEWEVPNASKPVGWPWAAIFWKPSPNNRIKELSKAGALIAAEIDRLNRDIERGLIPPQTQTT